MLNRVVLVGRLTKDVESRFTPNGKATCNFTLAIDRKFKNAQGEKETDFIPCCVPPYKDKLAELCVKYLSKGKLASVDGCIQVRSFNGQDGQKRWVTEVICEDVSFLSPRDEGVQTQQGQSPARDAAPQYGQPPYGAQQQYGQPPSHQQGYQQQPQGYPQPSQGYQQNQQGYQQSLPGYMPPPPSYQGQPPAQPPYGQPSSQGLPPGAVDVNQIGRQVSLDDDIPF